MCKKRAVYCMSELSQLTMKMFNAFNTEYFENKLPKVVITYEAGYKKGAYGWITVNKKWKSGKDNRHCINLSADYLDRPVHDICATLLHEMCHLYAMENDIKDTSRAGIYHKKFRDICLAHGLNCEEADRVGWSVTTLTESTRDFVDRSFGASEIRLYMEKPTECR